MAEVSEQHTKAKYILKEKDTLEAKDTFAFLLNIIILPNYVSIFIHLPWMTNSLGLVHT
jgi:hypothetical protein